MRDLTLGIFSDRAMADEAIDDLQAAGYQTKDISIVTKDTVVNAGTGKSAPVAEGAVSGATTGAVVGGIAGLLIGVGAIALPGVGGLLIGGPLAAALGLTGAAATTASGAMTGAVAGGLIGALTSLGVPEETAKTYENSIKEGGILVAVPNQAGGNTREVKEVLEQNGATQVTSI